MGSSPKPSPTSRVQAAEISSRALFPSLGFNITPSTLNNHGNTAASSLKRTPAGMRHLQSPQGCLRSWSAHLQPMQKASAEVRVHRRADSEAEAESAALLDDSDIHTDAALRRLSRLH